MPNHCETDFHITGPADLVNTVLEKHFTKEGTLDCTTVIPYPQKYLELDNALDQWIKDYCDGNNGWSIRPEFEGQDIPPRPTDGYNAGGYAWCNSNWGTKWGTYDGNGIVTSVMDEVGEVTASMTFRSAWKPPTRVFNVLAAMYPQLTFSACSYECGMGYKIRGDWEKGECIRNETHKYYGKRGG